MIEVKGDPYSMKYCSTCMIHREIRMHHCRMCDLCCSIVDHHCDWLGICVGRRNRRLFVFLLVIVMTTICFATYTIYVLIAKNKLEGGLKYMAYIFMIFYVVFFFLIGFLLSVQVLLIKAGLTTYEYLAKAFEGIVNPYD